MKQFKIISSGKFSTLALLLALFCSFSSAQAGDWHDKSNRTVTVMTQNMDAGTDFGYLFSVSDLPTAASLTYNEVLESDIPGHAAALAKIIAQQQPDLISLQEVTLWQTISTDQKTSVVYDQLDLLLKELKRLHTPYKVVLDQTLSQSQLPVDPNQILVNPNLIGPSADSIMALSFTDRDVIIARADLKPSELTLSHRHKKIYDTLLTLPLGPSYFTSKRGWLSVDAKIRGKSIRL